MKSYVQCIVFLLVLFIILLRPNFLVNLSNTYLGNVIFILLIIGLTFYDKLCGLLLLLMVISFKQIELEGMESSKEKGISGFRKRYCEGSIFKKLGKNSTLDDIKNIFTRKKSNVKIPMAEGLAIYDDTPIYVDRNKGFCKDKENDGACKDFDKIKFVSNVCNPCDAKCKFTVSSGGEQITLEEGLKSESSNDYNVKNIDTNDKQIEHFNKSGTYSTFSNEGKDPNPTQLNMYKSKSEYLNR